MESLFAVKFSYLIPLLPLLGAAVVGLFGARWLKGRAHWPIWIGAGASAVLSIMLLVGMLGLWHPDQEEQAARAASPATQPARGSAAEDGVAPRAARLSYNQNWYTWIAAGSFKATAGFFFDPLTAVMLVVVTGIGLLIIVFSKGYMAGEAGYFRFFAFLGLFIFSMTVLVMGNNFLLLYLGWEGVGLCSYLLIGYYYERPAAREAAKKAFLVNRIGDFGFGLGIMLIFVVFGRIDFFGPNFDGVLIKVTDPGYWAMLPQWKQHAIYAIPFLLMLGAFGKSAQFPLYVWLPDAMEGPTPVSALIHAATMVTAGVYMIVRCQTLFLVNQAAMITVAAVGAFTALLAATIALRQFDLKKVFAYSTISQLGYMFVGAAVLAPVAAIFHLMTHAFFKALLFLCSGVVMHAMMGELDMRKMSGLKRVLPWTNTFILVGCLALAGFPFFSGYFSKDEIISSAMVQSRFLAGVLLITALLTAYYTFRLYFRVFEGPLVIPATPPGRPPAHGPPADEHARPSAEAGDTHDTGESGVDEHLEHQPRGPHDQRGHHHEPTSMMIPLAILTLGALLAGFFQWPSHRFGRFLGESPSFDAGFNLAWLKYHDQIGAPVEFVAFGRPAVSKEEHGGEAWEPMMLVGALVSILGIFLAYVMHLKDRAAADRLAGRYPGLARLLESKYWVDEIYRQGIVEPLRRFGEILFAVDRVIIDGVVWLVGFVPQLSGFTLKLTVQRGSLQGYALLMLLCTAVILLVVFV